MADELPRKVSVTFRGEKVPDWKTAPREKATKAVTKFLSYTDNWFDPKYIREVADEAFRLVKEAIAGPDDRGDRTATDQRLPGRDPGRDQEAPEGSARSGCSTR